MPKHEPRPEGEPLPPFLRHGQQPRASGWTPSPELQSAIERLAGAGDTIDAGRYRRNRSHAEALARARQKHEQRSAAG